LYTFSDLYWVCLSVFSCTVLFVSISQVIGCEDRLRNHLYCVEWGVKLYSNQLWEKDWRSAGCWRVRLYPEWVSYFVVWEDPLHRKPDVSELWLYIFIRATLLASAVLVIARCLSVSVLSNWLDGSSWLLARMLSSIYSIGTLNTRYCSCCYCKCIETNSENFRSYH